MTNAFSSPMPAGPPGQVDSSLLAEIVNLANEQSNGQLIMRVRESMTSMVAALDLQANDLRSSKDHPLAWLFKDKKTQDAIKGFNKTLQNALKHFGAVEKQFELAKGIGKTFTERYKMWTGSMERTFDTIADNFYDTSKQFQALHSESSLFVDTVAEGRAKIRQLVEGITTQFTDQTNTAAPAPGAPSLSPVSNALEQAVNDGFSATNSWLEDRLMPALTSILGGVMTNGIIFKDGVSDIDGSLTNITLAITGSGKDQKALVENLGFKLNDVVTAIDRSTETASLANEEAKQNAAFAEKGTIVSRFSDFAMTQLLSLFGETPTKGKKGKVGQTTANGLPAGGNAWTMPKAGAGILGVAGIFAAFAGAGKYLFALLRPVLKKLPIIGSIISIGLGINRIRKGDVLGGLVEFGAALAYLVPIVGIPLGMGIDALLYMRDKAGGGSEGIAKGGKDIFKTGEVWTIIKDKLVEWWHWLNEKIGTFFNDTKKWLVDSFTWLKAAATTFFTVTIPKWLNEAWQWMKDTWDWLKDPKTIAQFRLWVKTAVSSITGFINRITDAIWNFFDGLPNAIYNIGQQISNWFKDAKWFGGDDAIFSVIGEYLSIIATGVFDMAKSIVTGYAKSVWSMIKGVGSLILTTLSVAWDAGSAMVGQFYDQYVKPTLQPIIDGIKEFPTKVWNWFKESSVGKFLFNIFGAIGKIIDGDFAGGITDLFPGVGGKLIKAVQGFTTDPRKFLLDQAKSIGSKATNTVLDAGVAIGKKVAAGPQMVENFLKSTYDWIFGKKNVQKVEGAIITNDGKVIKPHEQDTVWAAKPGEPLYDRMQGGGGESVAMANLQKALFAELQKVLTVTLNKALHDQGQMLASIVSQVNSQGGGAPVSGGGGGGSSAGTSEGERDPAYIHRMKAWHSISPPARMAY